MVRRAHNPSHAKTCRSNTGRGREVSGKVRAPVGTSQGARPREGTESSNLSTVAMSKIIIGKKGESLDLEVLLASRLLIQANSGGGKSWQLRRLIEQLFGKVQVIVVDPEGDFATLREKYDFVLVGKDGETPADIRSAGLLAHKLLELHASAVCDLYEMPRHDQHLWVKLFLESLINAPKKLWHPVVVVIDECHQFAPEKGHGESVALHAVADLASKGRKRGFALVAATQRLGKFSKDVAAELANVLVGCTTIDIDQKRAAAAMGVSGTPEFFKQLKMLEPGEFYGLGRAIAKDMIKFESGDVFTTHPKVGTSGKIVAPPPSDKVRGMLPQLSDLPAAAEEKIRTERELRQEIAELNRKLKAVPLPPLPPSPAPIPVLKDEQITRLERAIEALNKRTEDNRRIIEKNEAEISAATKEIIKGIEVFKANGTFQVFQVKSSKTTITVPPMMRPGEVLKIATNGTLPKCERAILTALAQMGKPTGKNKIAILSGYSVNSGGFNNSMGKLRSLGYIGGKGEVGITDEGFKALGPYDELPTGSALHAYWLKELPKCEAAILHCLIDEYPAAMNKAAIGQATGYSDNSGGFNNALGRLRTLQLIQGYGDIQASRDLFD